MSIGIPRSASKKGRVPMSVLRIALFGKLHAQWDQQPLVGVDAHKVQELFCYLLLYRDRPHHRETLADLLWNDHSTTQSRKHLRQTLWQLQAALDSQPHDRHILLVEPDWVQINPEADLWLDVAVFERAFALAQGAPGQRLDPQCAQALQDAVKLYRGDLLEGWYQDWCLYERERLQNMYLAMLDKLLGYCEACREYEMGQAYGACILRYDRARERTHRRLMRLQYLAGDRTAALRQYEYCVATLAEELGVKPAKRTVALYELIRADQLNAWTGASPSLEATIALLPEVLVHLKELCLALANIQHQIEQYMQDVERTLS